MVFTVDDGYRDIYEHAFEVFKRFDCTAAVFLTSDFIEGKLFFWWDAIEYVVNHANTSEFDLAFLGPGKFRAENLERRAELVARITEHCKLLNNADKLSFINDFGNKVGVEIPPVPPDEYAPLNWEQIKEMRTSGIEFFAHTVTHPILSKVPVEQQRNEICRSRAVLENHLNTRCDIFCYPNGGPGDFTEDTIAALKSAGFIAAVTGIAGFDSTKGPTDLFRIRRFSIPSNEILFKQYICGLENFKARLMSRG